MMDTQHDCAFSNPHGTVGGKQLYLNVNYELQCMKTGSPTATNVPSYYKSKF